MHRVCPIGDGDGARLIRVKIIFRLALRYVPKHKIHMQTNRCMHTVCNVSIVSVVGTATIACRKQLFI